MWADRAKYTGLQVSREVIRPFKCMLDEYIHQTNIYTLYFWKLAENFICDDMKPSRPRLKVNLFLYPHMTTISVTLVE